VLVLSAAAAFTLLLGVSVAVIALRWPRADLAAPSGRAVAVEVAEHPEAAADARRALGTGGTTVLGLSAAVVAVVAAGLVVGVLVFLVRSRSGSAGIDLRAARWAADNATPTSTAVLRVVTYLGASVFVLPLVVALGVVEARRVPNRSIPAFLLLVAGGELLLANVIKLLVDRVRPDIDQLAASSGPSFPSGHTTTAAAAFAALALLLGRRRSPMARVALASAAAALTGLVACTRVLLGVHWTTDVMAGAALGWGWAALCSIAFGGRLLRFGAPVEQAVTPAAWGEIGRLEPGRLPASNAAAGSGADALGRGRSAAVVVQGRGGLHQATGGGALRDRRHQP